MAQSEQTRGEPAAAPGPMAMCPMAEMCRGMTARLPSRLLLMLPGAVFVILGILILFEPAVLVWLTAIASILLGIVLLMLANFVHKIAARAGGAHG